MLYVARTLHMPSGSELPARVLEVSQGKVLAVKAFVTEEPAMVFVDEVYISSSPYHATICDIKKEVNHIGKTLYAFSADICGNLVLLV